MSSAVLTAWGLNHRTAPLALREQIAFLPEQLDGMLRQLTQVAEIQEAAILSTCHRTEIYCVGAAGDEIPSWLAQQHALDLGCLMPHLYQHQQQAGYQHLLRVACGLDSAIVGEPQILGQVKHAYHIAQQAGTIGRQLQGVFESIFSWSKRVRTQTAVSAQPVTLAYSAWLLIKQMFANTADLRVVMVGAGSVSTLVLRYLQQQGVCDIRVANRSLSHAQQLGRAISLAEVAEALATSDVLLCALSGNDWMLTRDEVAAAQARRDGGPLCLIDLSMPRRIEPSAHDLSDVFLYNVDDLAHMVADGNRARRQAAVAAEQVIGAALQDYDHRHRQAVASEAIRAFRSYVEQLGAQEMAKAQQALQRGEPVERVLAHYQHRILNQWLHRPTRQIHNLTPDDKVLLDAIVRLFS